jgi:hypothetical protein
MGRKAVSAAAGLAAAAASAVSGHAAMPVQAESYACNPNATLTVLWHPRGHGPIESLGFPAWSAPHVEFYRGARPGTDTYLVYAGTKGEGAIPAFTTNAYCLPSDETTPFLQAKGLKRLDGEAMLRCRYGRNGRFLATKLGAESYRIQAVLGAGVVVDALVKRSGSLGRFAASACTRSPVPS